MRLCPKCEYNEINEDEAMCLDCSEKERLEKLRKQWDEINEETRRRRKVREIAQRNYRR